jgi:hypothetical protein
MIKPEQIPDAVLKAFDISIPLDHTVTTEEAKRIVAKTLAAAINTWPKSWSVEENDSAVIRGVSGKFLPLKEASE